MTAITIYKTNTEEYLGFQCKGHAGYAEYGSDIVCAAISMLTINTVNSFERFLPELKTSVEADQTSGFLSFHILEGPNEKAMLLMNSLVLGLKEIEKQYGKKYLKLKFEEV